MAELRECPFCGELPIKYVNRLGDNLIECKNAKCKIHPFIANEVEQQAITLWNTRIEPEPKALTLEELQRQKWVWIDNDTSRLNKGYAQVFKTDKIARLVGIIDYAFKDYGKTWLAYASEPKGA